MARVLAKAAARLDSAVPAVQVMIKKSKQTNKETSKQTNKHV
jgi:hypothetical protein